MGDPFGSELPVTVLPGTNYTMINGVVSRVVGTVR